MKTLSDNAFFFDGEAASTVDKILQGYRALGYEISVYQYHAGYRHKDCPTRGIVLAEMVPIKFLSVECYTDTMFA